MLNNPDRWNTLAACVENETKNKSNKKWTGEEVQAPFDCEIWKKAEIYERYYKNLKEVNSCSGSDDITTRPTHPNTHPHPNT